MRGMRKGYETLGCKGGWLHGDVWCVVVIVVVVVVVAAVKKGLYG